MSLYKEEFEALAKPNNTFESDLMKDYPQYKDAETIKINEQDYSRLARGVSEGTIVDTKDNSRTMNIPIALSVDTWEQPMSPYNTTYPHNNVFETRNGLVQEFDDTEGNERYHRYHPSGTFIEEDSEGNVVRKTVGDNYHIIEKDGMVYIKGNCNLTVEGSCHILVMNDCKLEVNGNLEGLVKNDINFTASGCMNLNVKEVLKIRADNMIFETSKFTHKNIGRHTTYSNSKDEIVKDLYSMNIGKYSLTALNDIILAGSKISAKTDMHLKNNLYVQDEIHAPLFKGTAQYALYANGANRSSTAVSAGSLGGGSSPIIVNPAPNAPELEAATDTQEAISTGLIIPNDRVHVSPPEIDKSSPNTRLTRRAIENDGGEQLSYALYPGYNKSPPYISDIKEEEDEDITGGRAIPASFGSVYRKPIIEVENPITDSNYNTLISKYFSIADLTVRAAFPHSLVAQNGLNDIEIARNLQQLAVNILDKLVDEYGRKSFVITSGFRKYTGSGKPSQHELGQAVDIQFKIATNDYSKRAEDLIKILTFDQLLLEYQTSGTGKPWLHISFNKANMRRQYATFYNHKAITPFTSV
ncbi:MAG: hypothetical protein NTZ20_05690 [Candidatus Levybacteria bacterium]|nr:hypothetical protein [Candidatus Levybacteria bacterium]